jgi:hypothetical protein
MEEVHSFWLTIYSTAVSPTDGEQSHTSTVKNNIHCVHSGAEKDIKSAASVLFKIKKSGQMPGFFDRLVIYCYVAILELGEATNWKYAKPRVKNR